jgi:hypothetical protein
MQFKNEEILIYLCLIVVGYYIAKMFSKKCEGFSVGGKTCAEFDTHRCTIENRILNRSNICGSVLLNECTYSDCCEVPHSISCNDYHCPEGTQKNNEQLHCTNEQILNGECNNKCCINDYMYREPSVLTCETVNPEFCPMSTIYNPDNICSGECTTDDCCEQTQLPSNVPERPPPPSPQCQSRENDGGQLGLIQESTCNAITDQQACDVNQVCKWIESSANSSPPSAPEPPAPAPDPAPDRDLPEGTLCARKMSRMSSVCSQEYSSPQEVESGSECCNAINDEFPFFQQHCSEYFTDDFDKINSSLTIASQNCN